ncbi:hypothetical protein C8R47DRAFT_221859 [Mycena vitilis]|nr:hypothetical protein C8R47DRAFT_221859 [Mycena vitilis]
MRGGPDQSCFLVRSIFFCLIFLWLSLGCTLFLHPSFSFSSPRHSPRYLPPAARSPLSPASRPPLPPRLLRPAPVTELTGLIQIFTLMSPPLARPAAPTNPQSSTQGSTLSRALGVPSPLQIFTGERQGAGLPMVCILPFLFSPSDADFALCVVCFANGSRASLDRSKVGGLNNQCFAHLDWRR